eukprot:365433-Chlamydomonas_euryale.AAC.13
MAQRTATSGLGEDCTVWFRRGLQRLVNAHGSCSWPTGPKATVLVWGVQSVKAVRDAACRLQTTYTQRLGFITRVAY